MTPSRSRRPMGPEKQRPRTSPGRHQVRSTEASSCSRVNPTNNLPNAPPAPEFDLELPDPAQTRQPARAGHNRHRPSNRPLASRGRSVRSFIAYAAASRERPATPCLLAAASSPSARSPREDARFARHSARHPRLVTCSQARTHSPLQARRTPGTSYAASSDRRQASVRHSRRRPGTTIGDRLHG